MIPGQPEEFLDRAAVARERANGAEGRGQPVGTATDAMVDRREPARGDETLDEKVITRAVAATGQLLGPQRESQAPERERIEPAERSEQELCCERRCQRGAPDPRVDHREQGSRGVILPEGPTADGRAGRDFGERERPGDHRNLAPTAHDDRHVIPGNAIDEVSFAQLPRNSSPLAGWARRQDAENRRLGPVTAVSAGRPRPRWAGVSGGRPMADGTRGADAFRDPARELAKLVSLAMRRGQREAHHVRDAEHRCEAPERIRLSATEGVRCDIRITEGDDGHPACSEGRQEGHRGLRRFLEIINDDKTKPRRLIPRSPCGQRGDGELHQFRRVELVRARAADDSQILGNEIGSGHPLRAIVPGAEPSQVFRGETVLGRAHHEFAQLGAESAKAPHLGAEQFRPGWPRAILELAIEQLPDVAVLITAGRKPWRRGTCQPCGVPDNLEGERIDRPSQRAIGRLAESKREPVAQPRRRDSA